MAKNDSYAGGSTMVHLGSSWFSRPQPNIDPESGETRQERIRRLEAKAKRRKEKQGKQAKEKKKAPLNVSKQRAKEIEQRRQAKIERMRAILAEREHASAIEPTQSDVQQKERMSRVIVEAKRKRKIASPKN